MFRNLLGAAKDALIRAAASTQTLCCFLGSLTLRESLPELAAELETLLRKDNESALADQVQSLEVVDRCRCDSRSFATIYNVPKPQGAWRGEHRNILLDTEGLTVLDIVDERIVCIEMLDRDRITQQVHTLLP